MILTVIQTKPAPIAVTIKGNSVKVIANTPSNGNSGGTGVSAHSALTGLPADDHPQYHNDTRGDLRYYSKAYVDAALASINSSLTGKAAIAGQVFTGAISATNLSGTNTGNQTSIVGITSTLAEFNAALTGTDFATGGGTATGVNTGDQTTVSGNAGTATALQTARLIYGNLFDGSAALAQIIASSFGGTGNGFTAFTGPSTTEKVFTLPNASATILTSATPVTAAQGGTSFSTYAAGDLLYASAANTLAKLAAGTNTHVLTLAAGVPTWAAPSSGVAWGGITGTLASQTDLNTALGLRAFAANPLLTGTLTLDADVKLVRSAANTLAMQNGINAQGFQLYNTYTDASNYERGFFSWSGNTLQFGTEALGTGTTRAIEFKIGSTVVAAFGTPTNGMYARYITTENFWSIYDTAANAKAGGTGRQVYIDGGFGMALNGSLFYGISPAGDPYNTTDVRLYRGGAGIWQHRNGVNAQQHQIFNTYTDASNYERAYFKWAANVFDVGVEAAGTGTARTMRLNRLKGTTGAVSAALGSNCPAVTGTAPYSWVEVTTSDGSTAYIPAWK